MALTSADTRAEKRRQHHQARIDAAGTPARKANQAWSWLRAEVSQFRADEALRIVSLLAAQLNRGVIPRDNNNERQAA